MKRATHVAAPLKPTRLVWNTARLNGLLWFSIGVSVTVMIVLAFEAIP